MSGTAHFAAEPAEPVGVRKLGGDAPRDEVLAIGFAQTLGWYEPLWGRRQGSLNPATALFSPESIVNRRFS